MSTVPEQKKIEQPRYSYTDRFQRPFAFLHTGLRSKNRTDKTPAHQSHYDKPHLRTIEKRNLASGRCQYFPARPIHYAYRFGQTSLPGDVRHIARRRQLSGHTQRQVRERLCRLCQRTHTLRLEYPRRDYLRRLYPQ